MAEVNGNGIVKQQKFGITFDSRVSISTLIKVCSIIFIIAGAATTLQISVADQGRRISANNELQAQRYLELQQVMIGHTKALTRIELYLASKDKNYWHIVREYPDVDYLPPQPPPPFRQQEQRFNYNMDKFFKSNSKPCSDNVGSCSDEAAILPILKKSKKEN